MDDSDTTGTSVGERPPFELWFISQAPEVPGVYILFRAQRPVYIGVAAGDTTIRRELQRHLRGDFGPGTRLAEEFDYEASENPVALHRNYLALHAAASGAAMPES